MKLIISIPCFNEAETLPLVLKDIPKRIPGISEIEVQVVNDGSSDQTREVAVQFGCRVIDHKKQMGLGTAFSSGLQSALEHGADILVNTDGDNQYPGRYIAALVEPIVQGRSDLVIGNRSPWRIPHFGVGKRLLQYAGNGLTRRVAGVDVPDTVSGFRAYSREAMLRITVFTKYSYTLDTIVQASKKGLKISSVPIEVNKPTRPSRLFKNSLQFILTSAAVFLRVVIVYEAFKTFLLAALIAFLPGLFLSGRFLIFYLQGDGDGHIQSLVGSAILIILAGVLFALGILADLIGINRRIEEDQLYLLRKTYYGKQE